MKSKKEVLYAAIILNYNTAENAIQAAESIIEKSTTNSRMICIADGGSTKQNDIYLLQNYHHDSVETVIFSRNEGYAKGNNQAVEYVLSRYNPDYLLIMNPDIILDTAGGVERLIDLIQKDPMAIGGQPLVYNIETPLPAERQVQIRRVRSYPDVLIQNSGRFQKYFQKRNARFIYEEEMPYKGLIPYEVPSGAFFIIKTDTFLKVGMFDPQTFLYGEEEMLGFKIKAMGKHFLLDCNSIALHYQGKSTGAHNGKVTTFSRKCLIDSERIYIRDYLHKNRLLQGVVIGMMRANDCKKSVKKLLQEFKKR